MSVEIEGSVRFGGRALRPEPDAPSRDWYRREADYLELRAKELRADAAAAESRADYYDRRAAAYREKSERSEAE